MNEGKDKDRDRMAGPADDRATAAAPPQPLPQFPMMPMAYVLPQQLGMAYPGMQPAFRQPVRFQTVAYLPTPYGYLPFALDIIK